MPAAPASIVSELVNDDRCGHCRRMLQKWQIHSDCSHFSGDEFTGLVAAEACDGRAAPTEPRQGHQDIAARPTARREHTVAAINHVERYQATTHDSAGLGDGEAYDRSGSRKKCLKPSVVRCHGKIGRANV